ncbi:M15 family metallopeptidase [Pustulibacterium marinum]|nr:M15 family metallopeptidase [Pustulibacterium marinum]
MKKYIVLLFLVIACSETKKETSKIVQNTDEIGFNIEEQKDSIITIKKQEPSLAEVADTTFVRLANYSDDFFYDMRYATDNNFLKSQVYDCAECYTRAKTAQQLIKANEEFMKDGYHIKFYDCYRPLDVQKKMWKIVPNAMYVANPAKGSIHNKGGAVDITLVDSSGNELPMGTGFDFFGQKAHHTYNDLPEEILSNRKYLKSTMEKYGFQAIESEWWHYNLAAMTGAKVANFNWECN